MAMASWILRQIGPEAANELARLWAETFRQAYASVHSHANVEAYCAVNYSAERARLALSDPKQVCKFAYRDGEPTGLYVLKRHDCPIALQGESMELKQLYVLASEYGTGLGRVLMEDAIDSARVSGARHLWLAVADTNRRAQAFYLKHDLAPLGSGPILDVGTDRLSSTILARPI